MFLNIGATFNMSEEEKHRNWHQQEWIESDLGAPDVDVLQLGHPGPAIPLGDRNGGLLRVHVVRSLDQLAATNLTHCWFTRI